MDIVCCTDNNYIKYCCVMLTSLLENNKEENITIHILGDNLTSDSQNTITSIVEEKYNQHLCLYAVDRKLVVDFPNMGSYVSLTTYYKLFITSILPSSLHKVLYLDCDLIIVHSVKSLWDCDLTGKPLAAVKDAHKGMEIHCALLDIDCIRYGYFNAGVMLLNLDYLREVGFEKKAVDYVTENSNRLTFHEQDVFNGLFYKQVIHLPYRYNLHDRLYRRQRYIDAETLPIVKEELKSPVIIRFSSGKKPWTSRCLHPCRYLYLRYLDMTIWKGERPDMSWKERLWRWNRHLASCLYLANGYRKQY